MPFDFWEGSHFLLLADCEPILKAVSSLSMCHYTFLLVLGILLNQESMRDFVCLLQEGPHASICTLGVTFIYGYVSVFLCGSLVHLYEFIVWQQSLVLYFTSSLWTFPSLFRHTTQPWMHTYTYLGVQSAYTYLLAQVLWGHFENSWLSWDNNLFKPDANWVKGESRKLGSAWTQTICHLLNPGEKKGMR